MLDLRKNQCKDVVEVVVRLDIHVLADAEEEDFDIKKELKAAVSRDLANLQIVDNHTFISIEIK